jgi:serine/threonine protein kinase
MASDTAEGANGRSTETSMALRLSPTPVGAIEPERALSNRYELMGRLSTGGMATLHIARLVGLADFEKVVVLKRILPARVDDHDFRRMFEDEARVAATLEHPNIVHTHDIGQDAEGAFFTMEYLHGENVKRILAATAKAGEKLPLELALQIAIGCAAGLHHAHCHRDYYGRPLGIVHRDVSPSNIIVTYQSGVKLIDFGIAKAASGKHVTGVGVVKGKASYMSPEQCRGEAVDRRSDVFSLGIVLYEMTTMTRPFEAPDQLVVLAKILREDVVTPSKVRPDYPVALERVVMRALAKDPSDRYPSAFEMQEELELVTRECKLHALPGSLGRYLEHLFGAKPYPWAKFYRQQPPPTQTSRSGMFDAAATRPRQRVGGSMVPRDFDPNEMTTEPSRIAVEATEAADGDSGPAQPGNSIYVPTHATVDEGAPAANEPATLPRADPRTRGIAIALAVAAVALLGVVVASRDVAAPSPTPSDVGPSAVATAPLPTFPTSAPTSPPAPVRIDPPPPAAEPLPPVEPPATENAATESETPAELETATLATPVSTVAKPTNARSEKVREAKRLVDEGRRLVFADASRAVGLARKAVALHATQDGYALLGLAGCKDGDARAARTAYSHLRGSRRDDLARICESRGVALE